MKKLTTVYAVMLAALVTLIIPLSSLAQTQFATSEEFATAFLRTKTTSYVLLVGTRHADSDVWMNMEYTMEASTGLITNFNFHGTNIPLLKPLTGIPVPTNGYRDFNLTIVGRDATGNDSCQGYWYTNALTRSDTIRVTVIPKMPPVLIPFTADDPYAFDLVFDDKANAWYYYDWSRKGFMVWINDGAVRASYKLVNRHTGDIPPGGRGVVDVMKGMTTLTAAESPVNVHLAGNLLETDLTEAQDRYWEDVCFDSTASRPDVGEVPAKVFIIRGIARRQLYIWANRAGMVEVRYPDRDDVVPMTVISRADTWAWYLVDGILDDARVTVFPDGLPATDTTFNIQFSR